MTRSLQRAGAADTDLPPITPAPDVTMRHVPKCFGCFPPLSMPDWVSRFIGKPRAGANHDERVQANGDSVPIEPGSVNSTVQPSTSTDLERSMQFSDITLAKDLDADRTRRDASSASESTSSALQRQERSRSTQRQSSPSTSLATGTTSTSAQLLHRQANQPQLHRLVDLNTGEELPTVPEEVESDSDDEPLSEKVVALNTLRERVDRINARLDAAIATKEESLRHVKKANTSAARSIALLRQLVQNRQQEQDGEPTVGPPSHASGTKTPAGTRSTDLPDQDRHDR